MIDIRGLGENDVGKYVLYCPFGGADRRERGRIKVWSKSVGLIFVVYHCNNEWDRFMDFTGQGTRPEDLEFE